MANLYPINNEAAESVKQEAGYNMEEIVAAADKALYKSKEDGRNRYNAVEVGKGL